LIELADHLGYNDVSNFTKAFKRWYGLPPKQWQQSQLMQSVD
jgi:AraC-like DNA-binding protein